MRPRFVKGGLLTERGNLSLARAYVCFGSYRLILNGIFLMTGGEPAVMRYRWSQLL